MKSLTIEDLNASLRKGTWATQPHNEPMLNRAFSEAERVYLTFPPTDPGNLSDARGWRLRYRQQRRPHRHPKNLSRTLPGYSKHLPLRLRQRVKLWKIWLEVFRSGKRKHRAKERVPCSRLRATRMRPFQMVTTPSLLNGYLQQSCPFIARGDCAIHGIPNTRERSLGWHRAGTDRWEANVAHVRLSSCKIVHGRSSSNVSD